MKLLLPSATVTLRCEGVGDTATRWNDSYGNMFEVENSGDVAGKVHLGERNETLILNVIGCSGDKEVCIQLAPSHASEMAVQALL